MIVCPIMHGISDCEDHASRPNRTPAPNTIGTIPTIAQPFVRWTNVNKPEDTRIATGAP